MQGARDFPSSQVAGAVELRGDREPHCLRLEGRRRQLEVFDAEDLTRSDLASLVGDHVAPHPDPAQIMTEPTQLVMGLDVDDVEGLVFLGLRVVGDVDLPHGDVMGSEVEALHQIGLALVQVDRPRMGLAKGPRLVHRAQQLPVGGDGVHRAARGADVDLGGGPAALSPEQLPVAQPQLALLHQAIGGLLRPLAHQLPVLDAKR